MFFFKKKIIELIRIQLTGKVERMISIKFQIFSITKSGETLHKRSKIIKFKNQLEKNNTTRPPVSPYFSRKGAFDWVLSFFLITTIVKLQIKKIWAMSQFGRVFGKVPP